MIVLTFFLTIVCFDQQDIPKPKLLYFTTKHCGPCKAFEAAKRNIDSIKHAVELFDFQKIELEKDPKTVEKYGVGAYPTFLVLDDNNSIRHCWTGFGGPEDFIKNVAEAITGTTIGEKIAAYKDSKSYSGAIMLARIHSAQNQLEESLFYYREADSLRPENKPSLSFFIYSTSLSLFMGPPIKKDFYNELKQASLAVLDQDFPPEVKKSIIHNLSLVAQNVLQDPGEINFWSNWEKRKKLVYLIYIVLITGLLFGIFYFKKKRKTATDDH